MGDDETPTTVAELTARIEAGWEALQAAVGRLTEDQLTGPRSSDGWTVKDHLAHIAAWERSAVAILTGHPRHEALGVDEVLFESGSFDAINSAVQSRSASHSLEAVQTELADVHQTLLAVLAGVGDQDLLAPYEQFQPDADGQRGELPMVNWIVGNTYGHYQEHIPWIDAVAARQDEARATGIPGTWRRHNEILVHLLDGIPPEALAGMSASKGRTVGHILAHTHAVRLMWLDVAAPDLADGLAKIPKDGVTNAGLLRHSIVASGAAIAALLERALAAGKVKGFKAGPEAFFGYIMAHDWYHVGEVGIVLKQAGFPLTEEIAYGIWDQWSRPPE